MVAALLLIATQAMSAPPDTVVVCPSHFRQALRPWIAHRQAEGHQLAFVMNVATPQGIRADIRQAARGGKLRFVVLVGDAEPTVSTDHRTVARSVPTYLTEAQINVQWGSEPDIATDNWYADLDDDRIPDVAVGRLSVDTPTELKSVVKKILAYERLRSANVRRRNIHFIAGASGFGMLADMLLENTAKKILTDGIPAEYETTMTYANWRSPYCPSPVRFEQTVLGRLDEGCFVWVYLGHGHRTRLDYIHTPAGYAPVLEAETVARLNCPPAAPIAVLLACYAGAFDGPTECLAELMLRAEKGPVAVICGSRVTMPYGMSLLGTGLLREFFTAQQPTLGEVLLHSKRGMTCSRHASQRKLLDSVAKAVSPAPEQLGAECLEHLDLFNLLGDPLLKLRYAERVTLELPKYVDAGQPIQVRGVSPIPGKLLLEVVCRRDRLTFQPKPRHEFELSATAFQSMNEVYQQANDKRWASRQYTIGIGEFKLDLDVPARAQGPCHVRACVQSDNRQALGAADVYVRRPTTARAATEPRKR